VKPYAMLFLLPLTANADESDVTDCSARYFQSVSSDGIHALAQFFSDEEEAKTPLAEIDDAAGELSDLERGLADKKWSEKFRQIMYRADKKSAYYSRRYLISGISSNEGIFRLYVIQKLEEEDCTLYGVAFQYL